MVIFASEKKTINILLLVACSKQGNHPKLCRQHPFCRISSAYLVFFSQSAVSNWLVQYSCAQEESWGVHFIDCRLFEKNVEKLVIEWYDENEVEAVLSLYYVTRRWCVLHYRQNGINWETRGRTLSERIEN